MNVSGYYNKSGESGILCKLDMEKAYVYVNWNFLFYLIGKCGFRGRWCVWIRHCVSIACFNVLVNGSFVGFLNSSHNLRQGDLFSPVLFVIVMDALSFMLGATVGSGLLLGFMVVGPQGGLVTVSHLLFADDILLFCDVSPGHDFVSTSALF